VIRCARYLHAEDPRHEIPRQVFGREQYPRRPPYLLTDEQIHQLIELAAQSGYQTLRRQTYSTLFGLLSCTGLRVSEAIRLLYCDITADGLVIRETKQDTIGSVASDNARGSRAIPPEAPSVRAF
jgi:integrase